MATINICDICGTREGVERHSYVYDRCMNGGPSSEDQCENFDLCQKCELMIYRSLLRKMLPHAGSSLPPLNKYSFNVLVIEHIKQNQKRGVNSSNYGR